MDTLDTNRNKKQLNVYLTEEELLHAINFENIDKLHDLGVGEQANLNFKMKLGGGNSCYPIMLAVTKGNLEMIKIMLKNPTCNPNVTDESSGVTPFWLSAYYGHLNVMKELNDFGVNKEICHSITGTNVLHLAIEKRYKEMVIGLIEQGFDLNVRKKGGVTALMIACRNKISEDLARSLINSGADVNLISESGRSALSEAVMSQNTGLVLKLLSRGAEMFYEEPELRDKSPFFQAVDQNQNWAIDLFCDHGADLSIKDSNGLTAILRATKRKITEISLYLALRVG